MSTLMKHVQERCGDFPVSFRAARFSTAQQSVPMVQASTLVKEDSWDSWSGKEDELVLVLLFGFATYSRWYVLRGFHK